MSESRMTTGGVICSLCGAVVPHGQVHVCNPAGEWTRVSESASVFVAPSSRISVDDLVERIARRVVELMREKP